jgi:hypothetical protein
MNLSPLFKTGLFKSFFAALRATSGSPYLSMTCDATLKAEKKSLKNQPFLTNGVGS